MVQFPNAKFQLVMQSPNAKFGRLYFHTATDRLPARFEEETSFSKMHVVTSLTIAAAAEEEKDEEEEKKK